MFFEWFLRLTTPLRREAQFTPPNQHHGSKNLTLMQTFARASFCNCMPKPKIFKIFPEIPSQNCIEIRKGNSNGFLIVFVGVAIRPLVGIKIQPIYFDEHRLLEKSDFLKR